MTETHVGVNSNWCKKNSRHRKRTRCLQCMCLCVCECVCVRVCARVHMCVTNVIFTSRIVIYNTQYFTCSPNSQFWKKNRYWTTSHYSSHLCYKWIPIIKKRWSHDLLSLQYNENYTPGNTVFMLRQDPGTHWPRLAKKLNSWATGRSVMNLSYNPLSMLSHKQNCHIHVLNKKSIVSNTHHDDVIKWEHSPRYWPFVWGIHWSPVNSPHKWPVTRSFDVFFDLCLNKRLSKQSRGWWFETPLGSLWRHCNAIRTLSLDQGNEGAWPGWDTGWPRHYNDASLASWRFKSVATRPFVRHIIQACIEENIEAPHYTTKCQKWGKFFHEKASLRKSVVEPDREQVQLTNAKIKTGNLAENYSRQ